MKNQYLQQDCERGSNWTWRGLPVAQEEGGKHE